MKHLNQINAVLVILGLGIVFYSLSQTYLGQQPSPVQVVTTSETRTSRAPLTLETTPAETEARSPRNRPGTATGNNSSNRRNPISGSPQLANPARSGNQSTAPNRSRTRVLTTPSPTRRQSTRPNNPTSTDQPNSSITATEFQEAVERTRNQGGVPIRSGVTPAGRQGTQVPLPQNQGRRRQTAPPPARASMSNRRPPA